MTIPGCPGGMPYLRLGACSSCHAQMMTNTHSSSLLLCLWWCFAVQIQARLEELERAVRSMHARQLAQEMTGKIDGYCVEGCSQTCFLCLQFCTKLPTSVKYNVADTSEASIWWCQLQYNSVHIHLIGWISSLLLHVHRQSLGSTLYLCFRW